MYFYVIPIKPNQISSQNELRVDQVWNLPPPGINLGSDWWNDSLIGDDTLSDFPYRNTILVKISDLNEINPPQNRTTSFM